jgi:hypothetical protein
MKIKSMAAAVLSLATTSAAASCSWEWLCNGEGVCKQMPVCDSVYDKPEPRPEASTPPAPPPVGMRPHKLVGSMGTLSCEHIMRKSRSGRWTWSEACFCTDPRKAADPSAPFANIVRCETPWKE